MTSPHRKEPEEEADEYPPQYGPSSANDKWWGIFGRSKWAEWADRKLDMRSTSNKAQTVEYAWRAAWLELSHIIEKLHENHKEITGHERSLKHLRKEEVELQARLSELIGPLAVHGFGPPLSEPETEER